MGTTLVLCVAVLYVGSGVAIQVLFEELNFEKPFFFSYVSVSLCSVHLLQYFYLRGRRSWLRGTAYRQLEQLDTVEQRQVSILNEPWLLVRPALLLSPAYFCLNYTYFLSLDLTSVSETMILSASTGVWTLLFSRLLLKEHVTQTKLATVAFSIFGMCLVTYSSRTASVGAASLPVAHPGSTSPEASPAGAAARSGDEMDEAGAGDLLALMSAAASGIYVVLLRACVPDEDSVHMPSLFGMIGLVSALCFAPLFPLFHYSGVEEFELPPTRSAIFAVLLNAAQRAESAASVAPTAHGPGRHSSHGRGSIGWTLLAPGCATLSGRAAEPPRAQWEGCGPGRAAPAKAADLCAVATPQAVLSTVLPDMLLAQAVVMTSPLLATLGLSTMIPLSVVADYSRGLANLTPKFFLGTVCVFVGFQLENWAEYTDMLHTDAAKAGTH